MNEYLQQLNDSNNKDSRIKLKKITSYIHALKNKGFALKEPYIKKIDDEIWELRPINDRFLFVGVINNRFVILTHFVKKTSKTSKGEIEKAKRYLKDFIERGGFYES